MTKEQLEKLKQDPEKYEAYKQKKREYQQRYIQKMKTERPEKYKTYIQNISRYNKNKFKDDAKKAVHSIKDKQCRDKRGKEYIKNYMKQYRKQNKNNIKEKEHIYGTTRRREYIEQNYNYYRAYIINYLQIDITLKRLYDLGLKTNFIKAYINAVVIELLTNKYNVATGTYLSKYIMDGVYSLIIKELQNYGK